MLRMKSRLAIYVMGGVMCWSLLVQAADESGKDEAPPLGQLFSKESMEKYFRSQSDERIKQSFFNTVEVAGNYARSYELRLALQRSSCKKSLRTGGDDMNTFIAQNLVMTFDLGFDKVRQLILDRLPETTRSAEDEIRAAISTLQRDAPTASTEKVCREIAQSIEDRFARARANWNKTSGVMLITPTDATESPISTQPRKKSHVQRPGQEPTWESIAKEALAKASQPGPVPRMCKTPTPFKDAKSGTQLCLEDDVTHLGDHDTYRFSKDLDAESLENLRQQNPGSRDEDLEDLISKGPDEIRCDLVPDFNFSKGEKFQYQITIDDGKSTFPWGTRFESSNPLFRVSTTGLLEFMSPIAGDFKTVITCRAYGYEDKKIEMMIRAH